MIKFTKGYLENTDKVKAFNLKHYSHKDSLGEYLDYRLQINPFSNNCDLSIFASSEDQILGQILLMCSELKLNLETKNFVWGMDYVVTEDYRQGPIGVGILKKAIRGSNHMGIGLGEESLKVHLALNFEIFSTYNMFLSLNFRGVANFLAKKLKRNNEIRLLDKEQILKVNQFVLADDAGFRSRPYNNFRGIEMTRSKDFLNWRFFYKPCKYWVFFDPADHGLTYFVVRPVKFKGFDIILLVDYRFSEINIKYFEDMMKAVKKIVSMTRMDGIITLSSLAVFSSFLRKRGFFSYKSSEIVSNFVTKEDVIESQGILITLADSDGDFYFSKNKWSYS